MATTVEIRKDQREKLLAPAAGQDEEGRARLVEEAVDHDLESAAPREERVRRAVAAIGSLDEAAAERLEESARRVRATWR